MNRKLLFQDVNFILQVLISFTLPFSISANSLLIILAILNWIFQGNLRGKFKILIKSRISLAFILFYLLHVIGFFYSENEKIASFNLEKKLSFLIFPIIFLYSITYSRFVKVLKAFVFSQVVVIMICSFFGFYKIYSSNLSTRNWDLLTNQEILNNSNPALVALWDNFSYINLTSILKFHPTYFSLYLAFSIFITIFLINSNRPKKLVLNLTLVLFLSFFLILASSRIVILSFLLLFIPYFGFKIFQRYGALKAFGLMAVMSIGIASTIYLSPVTRYRIFRQVSTTEFHFPTDHNKWNSTNLRLAEWFCSLKVLKNNPITGVGIGDTQDNLFECYKELDLGPYLIRYNAHNLYLETAVSLGIIGFLSLIVCFAMSYRVSIARKNILMFAFLALFSLTSITESTLEVQKGVVFLNFFLFLFLQKEKFESNKILNA